MIKTSFNSGFFFIGFSLDNYELEYIVAMLDFLIEVQEGRNEDTSALREHRDLIERMCQPLH